MGTTNRTEFSGRRTSNHQLEEMAKQLNLKHFGKVVMSDELEQFKDKENITFIFNFQDSSKIGSH